MNETTEDRPLAVQRIPMHRIQRSKFNPRRELGDLTELRDSMAAHGLLQPIKVRPIELDEHGQMFEVVYGNRRFAVATELGWDAIDAAVESLTDPEALEEAIHENAAREDVHPMDEAEAIDALVGQGRSVAEIASIMGVSPSRVASRRRLLGLFAAGRQAFREDLFDISAAVVVARLSDQRRQDELVADLRERAARLRQESGRVLRHEGLPFRAADVSYDVRRRLAVLTTARFPLDEVVAERSPCSTCPQRTGTQTVLFADAIDDDDLCTYPPCFEAKLDAHWKAAKARAKKAGAKVLASRDAKEAFETYNDAQVAWGSEYVDAEIPIADNYDLRSEVKRTPKRWIEDEGVDVPLKLARDPVGRARWLVPKKALEKALRVAAGEPERPTKSKATRDYEERLAKIKAKEAADKKAAAAVRAAGLAAAAELGGADLSDELLRALLLASFRSAGKLRQGALVALDEELAQRQEEALDGNPNAAPLHVLEEMVPELARDDLVRWLVRAAVIQESDGPAEAFDELAQALALDAESIRAEVLGEQLA